MVFGENPNALTVAILIKRRSLVKSAMVTNYINPLVKAGIDRNKCIAFSLTYHNDKCSVFMAKEYLAELLPELDSLGIATLYCADSTYFKYLTKNTKADVHQGYACDCAIKGYEHFKVILGVNYQAVIFNPAIQSKLDASIQTLIGTMTGNYKEPGSDIIHLGLYPETVEDIRAALINLNQYKELTCDIEGLSLKFYSCGISTITFCWDEHHGIAFPVDRGEHGPAIRELLKEFLTSFDGKFIYHNGGFDMKVLIYNLWMQDLGDVKGMIDGIEILSSKFDDTKLIAYLATNNTVKNELKLKVLAQEFAGNYAQEDIKYTSKIPLPDLLKYNLIDGLSTWYVYKKYYPIMVADDQLPVYLESFKPCVKVILQMELTGMPIDPVRVQEAKAMLEKIVNGHRDFLQNHPIIKDFHYGQLMARVDADNLKLKKKVRVIEDLAHIKFNPGSDKQLQGLIFDYLGYDVIDTTDSGQPATGWKTLDKLINHAKSDEHKEIFENLIGLTKADKILTSFIPAFEQAQQLPDGSWRLYGNYNLGGTQSGRLSSSDPNMQNTPSGSVYAKIIKKCFISLINWLFCGADFKALEAVTEALLSRDPNKLKVYIDGFDSHCVNTFAYFGDEMPDIKAAYEMATNTKTQVEIINSIQVKYKPKRQKSKAPTFALTYKGTWRTIMKSAGVAEKMAKQIEDNYHTLYVVSDMWIDGVLDQAHKDGYITGAFGLRIRTPILKQTVLTCSKMPYPAAAERRSAGNAKTQSYGMLNSRAAIEFQDRVLNSPYKYDILVSSLIHDAIYILVHNNLRIVKWANDNLIDCMRWQELPELQHDIVKMGAEMEIFWPHWGTPLQLPNDISTDKIRELAYEHKLAEQGYCYGWTA